MCLPADGSPSVTAQPPVDGFSVVIFANIQGSYCASEGEELSGTCVMNAGTRETKQKTKGMRRCAVAFRQRWCWLFGLSTDEIRMVGKMMERGKPKGEERG